MANMHGQTTVAAAGTSVPLETVATASSPTLRYCSRVVIQGLPTNTQKFYVGIGSTTKNTAGNYGWSGSAFDSIELYGTAGNNDIDLTQVYVDVDVNGEGVSWITYQL